MRWRDNERVIIVGATNQPQALDPSLRRAGRLDNEIVMRIPLPMERKAILERFISCMHVSAIDLDELAGCTHGFTGADLAGMCDAAGMRRLREHVAEVEA